MKEGKSIEQKPKLQKGEWMPELVGGTNEPTNETYTTKHGLTIRRSSDIGNTHWEIFKSMADRDPDLISNMKAGRYMPRANGYRTVYRGKDTGLGIRNSILGFLFDPLIIGMIILLILVLLVM